MPNDNGNIFIEIQTINDTDDDDVDDDEPATRSGDTTTTKAIDRPLLQRLNTVVEDPEEEAAQMASNLKVDFHELIYLNRIGDGSFGDIFRAKYRGMTVAAKRIKKEVPTRSTTKSEPGSDSNGNGKDQDKDNSMVDGSFRMGRRMSTRRSSSHFVSDEKDDVRNGKRLSSAHKNLDDMYRKSENGSDESDAEDTSKEDIVDTSALSDFRREVQILKTIRHPNVVLLLAYSTIPNNEVALYELMECSLLDLLQKHDDSKTKMKPRQQIAFAIDLCSGMHYLHSCRPFMALHRDLKPSNCLIDPYGRLKVCDFGLSKLIPADVNQREEYKMTGETGTYRFMAPEVFGNEPHYDQSIDVYSFAMLFYNIMSGNAPWPTAVGTTVAFITSRGERPPIEKKWDPRLRYLLKECWHHDPIMRPSFARVLDTLTSYQLAVHGGKKVDFSARRRQVGAPSLRSIFSSGKNKTNNTCNRRPPRLTRGVSTSSHASLFSTESAPP